MSVGGWIVLGILVAIAIWAIIKGLGAVLDCPLPPLLESLDPATLAA